MNKHKEFEDAEKVKADRHALIQALGLEYKAVFVPFSQSRNKAEKHTSLNWVITLAKGRQTLQTDYMQGCAHVPEYNQRERTADTRWYSDYIVHVCETGRYVPRATYEHVRGIWKGQPVPAPLLTEVLYSLVMDSDVLDAGTFEQWAGDLGYDTDSRKAENIYRACLENALRLRVMIGDANLVKLRELFQDY